MNTPAQGLPPRLLYEAVRWGNDSDDIHTGGPNGHDTCFLVRAASVQQAAALADAQLSRMPHEHVVPWCAVVYLLGIDTGTDRSCRILRGPYVQHAYGHGWPQWQRQDKEGAWGTQPQERPDPDSPVYPVREISESDSAFIASLKPIPTRVKFTDSGGCLLYIPPLEAPATFRWLGRDIVCEHGVLAWTSRSKHASVLQRREWHPHTILVAEDVPDGGMYPIGMEA